MSQEDEFSQYAGIAAVMCEMTTKRAEAFVGMAHLLTNGFSEYANPEFINTFKSEAAYASERISDLFVQLKAELSSRNESNSELRRLSERWSQRLEDLNIKDDSAERRKL